MTDLLEFAPPRGLPKKEMIAMRPTLFYVPMIKFGESVDPIKMVLLLIVIAVAVYYGLSWLMRKMGRKPEESVLLFIGSLAVGAGLWLLAMKGLAVDYGWGYHGLHSYGLALGLAFLAGWYLIPNVGKRNGLIPETWYTPIILAAIFSIVGSRVFYHFSVGRWDEFLDIFRGSGGMVAIGGFVGGIGAGVAFFIANGYNTWRYLDSATPAFALGLAIVRSGGCFLNGCCYGQKTDFITGLSFPGPNMFTAPEGAEIRGSLAYSQHLERGWVPYLDGRLSDWTVHVHPTQLYEASFGVLMFILTIFLATKRKLSRGMVFLTFIGGYSLWRFGIEFIRNDEGRGNPLGFSGISASQLYSALTVLFAVGALFYLLKNKEYQNPPRWFRYLKKIGFKQDGTPMTMAEWRKARQELGMKVPPAPKQEKTDPKPQPKSQAKKSSGGAAGSGKKKGKKSGKRKK